MSDPMDVAKRHLLQHFGYGDFRPTQERVLRSIFAGHDTLGVLPTGAGKSLCFQIPALVRGGLTVVVSPLISLMDDQVGAAMARGIPAACLTSAQNDAERETVWKSVVAGALRLLYVSPERLQRLAPTLRDAGIRPSLLAVDEAHCIAEWGHDFRPAFRTLRASRYRLGEPQTIALTGSATPEVRADIVASLGLGRRGRCETHLASFDRRNLWFGAVRANSERHRLETLLGLVRGDDRIAIVYAPTRNSCEGVARALRDAGLRSAAYHAGLGNARRRTVLDDFLESRFEVVVATSAFGMGIDKPDVRLVVHWSPPPTPESYYQEAGRAGRDGAFARCVLLWRGGDAELHRRQLGVTFPDQRLVERIWARRAPPGTPANVLEAAERLRRELRPERGPVDWKPVEARQRHALERIAAVEAYASAGGCRRKRLVRWFGETLPRCAGCDRCRSTAAVGPTSSRVASRIASLQRALRGRSVWGGSPLEPQVLRRLAEDPPLSAAALAGVPGVGVTLAERCGATILAALGDVDGAQPSLATDSDDPPLLTELIAWRRTAALALGAPDYVVLADDTLRAIAVRRPADLTGLRAVPGLGPRALAKHGSSLLSLIQRKPPPC